MTFEKLTKILEKYSIPRDVHFLSDSGWECGPTEINGVWYSPKDNTITFTQTGLSNGEGYLLHYDREEAEYRHIEWDSHPKFPKLATLEEVTAARIRCMF